MPVPIDIGMPIMMHSLTPTTENTEWTRPIVRSLATQWRAQPGKKT